MTALFFILTVYCKARGRYTRVSAKFEYLWYSPLSVTGYFYHTGSIILKYLVTVADTGSSEAVTAASPTAATTDFMSIKI